MFIISYSDLIELPFYSDFSAQYMSGLRVMHMSHAKALVNVDAKTAFVYSE